MFSFTIDYFDYSFNGTLPGISNTAGFESQLLDLVLLKMSPEGALLNQVLIPKNQFSPFQNYPLFYHYRMRHFLRICITPINTVPISLFHIHLNR
ncbi:MAG: hypothetical protein HWD58_05325 [Bacteroidota bacterium]|nr:MAG: hypothetical protein HWD58_05325 [Bacteroidota bacterium]